MLFDIIKRNKFIKILAFGFFIKTFYSVIKYLNYKREPSRNCIENIHSVVKINLFNLKKNINILPSDILDIVPYYINFTIKAYIDIFGIKYVIDKNISPVINKCTRDLTLRNILNIPNITSKDYAYIDYYTLGGFPEELKKFFKINESFNTEYSINSKILVIQEKPKIHYHKELEYKISDSLFQILRNDDKTN